MPKPSHEVEVVKPKRGLCEKDITYSYHDIEAIEISSRKMCFNWRHFPLELKTLCTRPRGCCEHLHIMQRYQEKAFSGNTN
jgi:hypothetical protein